MVQSLQEFISSWSTNYQLSPNKANGFCQKMKMAPRPRCTECRKGQKRLAASSYARCHNMCYLGDPTTGWQIEKTHLSFSHSKRKNPSIREEGNRTKQEQGWGGVKQAKQDNKLEDAVAAAKFRCAKRKESAPGVRCDCRHLEGWMNSSACFRNWGSLK